MNRKGTAKLEFIKNIEDDIQKLWEHESLFESNFSDDSKEKHFVTFPYPYMNGVLHLGHGSTLLKCEFSMGFERLQGKNTLWGFGLHCTGMPIKASSDKLSREIKEFGYPPVFPKNNNEDEKSNVKSKVAAKSGGFKYQWQIMQNSGMSDEEILKFTDVNYWLEYYPPLCIKHLKRLGVKVDWRRSFLTTDVNPFYDSFVRWQFKRLKESEKIMFGKRETIYSPLDGQPCMDHDRTSGEGVGPQEYTLIKMKLLSPYPKLLKELEGQDVFLVAATLRPETMYGQTNCWIHPTITYAAVKTRQDGVILCVERSAKNMAYQDILSDELGKMEIITKVKGVDLMGCALKAPLSSLDKIYVLPMLTIKETKGTGIVTSVPSDAPDDFAALRDLKNKAALREKYGITDEMVLPFDPIPIIDIPEIGTMCAKKYVEELKIQSQNDTDKLLEAKEKCYKYGFYNGKVIVGKYAGRPVSEVKDLIQEDLIKSGEAIRYFEPEKQVISRSGDECVVAKCEQWYLNYRDPEWKDLTRKCLGQLNTFCDEVRRNFEATLDNLHEHACSRSYGLGSKIPWDEQYLVESLSDSTIYMAYYTVAHLLQRDALNGQVERNEIGISQMNDDYWEYVLGDKNSVVITDETMIPKLERLRKEFLYWYPVDLRVSGKDLVPNHLTYYLYNHVAIWPDNPEQFWPKSIRSNGHLLLNNEKMSKSTGNFMTIEDAIEKYSADGMRLALADSGDTIEDANFVEDMADKGLLKLYTFIDWAKDFMVNIEQHRNGEYVLHADKIFRNVMNRTILFAEQDYKLMMYKRVVKTVFHELLNARDRYVEITNGNVHSGLILRFIELECLLLSPICPHTSEYVWTRILHKNQSIMHARWPEIDDEVNEQLNAEEVYLDSIAYNFRQKINHRPKKAKDFKVPNKATIWIAESFVSWQTIVLNTLVELSVNGALPENKAVNSALNKYPELGSKKKKAMDFIQFVRTKCDTVTDVEKLKLHIMDEKKVILDNLSYLERTLKLDVGRLAVRFSADSNDEKLIDDCSPGEPRISVTYEDIDGIDIEIVNPQIGSGMGTYKIRVNAGDNVTAILRKVATEAGLLVDIEVNSLCLYRFTNVFEDMYRVPHSETMLQNLTALKPSNIFKIVRNEKEKVNIIYVDVATGESYEVGEKMKVFYAS